MSLLILALAPLTMAADDVKLELMPKGAMQKIGFYAPKFTTYSDAKPANLKSPDLSGAKFGTLAFDGSVAFVWAQDGDSGTLIVDTNRNGDLTDDQKVALTFQDPKLENGARRRLWRGDAQVSVPSLGKTPVNIGVYVFHPTDIPQNAGKLFYYRDYAASGTVTLGGKKYNVMLSDEGTTGSFKPGATPINLLIDVNGNGKVDSRGEMYDITKPFNLGGTTYELSNVTAGGFTIGESSQKVAEVLPPPDFGVGKKALAFKASTLEGKQISFPESYKGKLVLLDFWATWCGPCIAELPNLLETYSAYHGQGFEILGISFDRENMAEKVKEFTKEKGMSWQHVYEGKFWNTEVGTMYAVDSIPRAYLVDGDTGEIVATGNSLRGKALKETVGAALAKKKGL